MIRKIAMYSTLAATLGVMPSVYAADATDTSTSSTQTTTTSQPMNTSTTATTADQSNSTCRQHFVDYLTQNLNLTSDQQTKIQALRDQTKDSLKSDWQQLKTIKTEIRQLVMSDSLDQDKMNSLIQQKTNLMSSMMKTRITMHNQIYNVLNAQQKQQFDSLMSQWENARKAWRKSC